MSANVFELQGSISLDSSEFEKAVKAAVQQGKSLGEGIERDAAQMTELQKEIGRLANELSAAQEEIGILKSELDKSSKSADQNADSTANLSKEADRVVGSIDNLADVVRELSREEEKGAGKTDDYGESAQDAADDAKKLEKETDKLGDTSGKTTEKIGALATGIKDGLVAATKVGAAAVTAAAAGITAIVKSSLDEYSSYEQLVGGVDTLFKDASSKVQEYADSAYMTAGLSANEYMETVTSFSASLLQGLGGDTEKAADIADMAITDMSDNANKMGTDMQSIQNAYQGFAKQNYTMLDNLKLGRHYCRAA